MNHREPGLRRLLPPLALALASAVTYAGISWVATPAPVAAIVDCQPDTPPVTADDPSTPGDPHWSVLEDGLLDVPAPGFLANDQCTDSLITMGYTTTYPFTLTSDGRVLFAPAPDFYGTAHTDYSITGPGGQSNVSRITVTVTPVNDKPNWGQGGICEGYVVAEDSGPLLDGPCIYQGDPGGGSVEATAQTLTTHASSSNPKLFSSLSLAYTTLAGGTVTAHLTFFLAPNANGSATVTVWVTDNGGTAHGGVDTSTKYTESVTVTPVDDPPQAVNDGYATGVGQTLIVPSSSGVLKNDTDIDGPALAASKVSGPSHGFLALNANGSFSYTPTAGFSGSDSFVYRATSGALSDTATVALAVTAAGASVPPSLGPGPSATAAGSGLTGSESPTTSGLPSAGASGPSPTSGPTPGSPGGGGGFGPWPWLILLAVVVAIGANVAYAQYLRSKRPPSSG